MFYVMSMSKQGHASSTTREQAKRDTFVYTGKWTISYAR